jgi:hypothetical protein
MYLAKAKHDRASANGCEPPRYVFLLKFLTASMFGYAPAVPSIWQVQGIRDKCRTPEGAIGSGYVQAAALQGRRNPVDI